MPRYSIPLDVYDFGDLGPEGRTQVVLRRAIPAPFARGTLAVRVHELAIGAGSEGSIAVTVRADAPTRDDPSTLFFGDALATVLAVADGDAAPRYLTETFAAKGDHLMVQLEAQQDFTVPTSLSVKISVELLLDDGPLEWTPAALEPDAWWRADLGHALVDQDPVSAWANQGTAGSAGDVGQGTSTLRPVFVASHASFNGQAVLDFDGGDVLYATAGTWWEQTADGESMTVVAVARATVADNGTLAQTRAYATVGGLQFQLNTAGSSRWYLYDTGAVERINCLSAGATQNALHVMAGVLEGAVSPAADTASGWIDGALGDERTADLGVIAASSAREWCIGGASATVGNFTGQIAELLFLKRGISASEDAELTRYLNARYGLSLSGVTQ